MGSVRLFWRDSVTLFRHATEVTSRNYVAHGNLGLALTLFDIGNTDGAIRHFEAAIKFRPGYAQAFNDLGIALGGKGDKAGSVRCFKEAVRLQPDFGDAHYNLAITLASTGDYGQARKELEAAEQCGVQPAPGVVQNISGSVGGASQPPK